MNLWAGPRFMRLKRLPLLLVFVTALLACWPVAYAALPVSVDGAPLPSLAPMLKRSAPAVVNIATYASVTRDSPLYRDPFFRRFFQLPEPQSERRARSAGSGVIVDAQRGWVVTNHHVIEGADSMEVTLNDGRTVDAQLIGSDAQVDLALLQIQARDLVAMPLADPEQLNVGDFVVAIGDPFGLGQTVTSGIVSALGRSGLGILGYEDFIQTDASINPGNSGGALLNLNGELVGINSAILAPAGGSVGIGFAIPVDILQMALEQFSRHGEIRRGLLGVVVQDISIDLAEAFGLERSQGALVTDVHAGSAGERAGLKRGDIILQINGRKVLNGAGFRNRMGLLSEGQEVQVVWWRDGEQRQVALRLDAAPDGWAPGGELSKGLRGLELENYLEDGQSIAVRIRSVEASSPAAESGLRTGDFIVAANRYRITSTDALREVLSRSRSVVLRIQRGDGVYYLNLR